MVNIKNMSRCFTSIFASGAIPMNNKKESKILLQYQREIATPNRISPNGKFDFQQSTNNKIEQPSAQIHICTRYCGGRKGSYPVRTK